MYYVKLPFNAHQNIIVNEKFTGFENLLQNLKKSRENTSSLIIKHV